MSSFLSEKKLTYLCFAFVIVPKDMDVNMCDKEFIYFLFI